jgi:peptide/nickel transport system ATP-binding protein
MRTPLLRVDDLKTHFETSGGTVKSVDGVSFTVEDGQTVCIVGESGSGKSITARSIMGLVRPPGRVMGGRMDFRRRDGSTVDLATLPPTSAAYRDIRGREIGMIFQEPMSALSPVHSIGSQLEEGIRLHLGLGNRAARDRAVDALEKVGFPGARDRLGTYPFQLSGGLRQRVCIAMALACEPSLLIADEPTTALDVTTQANILELLMRLQAEFRMAIVFITHDLGVVAEIADRVVVMYLGQVVEAGPAPTVLRRPSHPYTRGLLRCVADIEGDGALRAIRGIVPHPLARPQGCPFNTRCDEAVAGVCDRLAPDLVDHDGDVAVRCHLVAPSPEIARALPAREVVRG